MEVEKADQIKKEISELASLHFNTFEELLEEITGSNRLIWTVVAFLISYNVQWYFKKSISLNNDIYKPLFFGDHPKNLANKISEELDLTFPRTTILLRLMIIQLLIIVVWWLVIIILLYKNPEYFAFKNTSSLKLIRNS